MLFVFFCLFILLCFFFFSFPFLEFINGVHGLRWMYCKGIVTYYGECTTLVKKWYGSDYGNRGY